MLAQRVHACNCRDFLDLVHSLGSGTFPGIWYISWIQVTFTLGYSGIYRNLRIFLEFRDISGIQGIMESVQGIMEPVQGIMESVLGSCWSRYCMVGTRTWTTPAVHPYMDNSCCTVPPLTVCSVQFGIDSNSVKRNILRFLGYF